MSAREALDGAMQDFAAGRFDRAQAACRALLAQRPDWAPALNLLGAALHRAGRSGEAIHALERARAQHPDDPSLLNTLAVVRRATGDEAAALALLDRALAIEPGFVEGRINRAELLEKKGQRAAAAEDYGAAHRARPDDVRGASGLGRMLTALGRTEEAAPVFAMALARHPRHPTLRLDHASNLAERGRHEEALAVLDGLLAEVPGYAKAWANRATILREHGRFEEAVAAFDRAIELDPQAAVYRFYRAVPLMLAGRIAEGWQALEARWARTDPGATPWRPFPHPVWRGEDPAGRTLLVWGEQGVGDTILYAGMIPELLARGARVVLEVERRLVPLLARSFPEATVIAATAPPDPRTLDPDIAWHVPIGSLGAWLRADLAAFGDGRSYLKADPGRVRALRARYSAPPDMPLVGITWSSRAHLGRAKSVPAAALAAALPGARLVSLEAPSTAAPPGVRVDPAVDPYVDLDEAAAQIAALDLVVACSNTAAHIAAALGVETWILQPRGRGLIWYWFADRSDSPWYRSVRLFRQARLGDWTEPLAAIAAAFKAWRDER